MQWVFQEKMYYLLGLLVARYNLEAFFLICKSLNFNFYESSAIILQAGTPTAISTILMAEAYGVKQQIASKILFTTTLISIITIPLLKIFMNLFI